MTCLQEDCANWARVGCPDCRAIGQDTILAEQQAQQGRQADVA